MKFFKKVLVLILIIGIIIGGIWGIGKFKVQSEKLKVAEEQKTEEPIKFAVMSDIHSDWENFRKALVKAKEDLGGDEGFVIITGDLTTLGKKSELLEAKKILDESGLKYYVIPGNHDIWWGRKFKEDLWKEVFGKSFLSFTTSSRRSAGLRGASKDSEVKFILINNADGEGGFEGFGDIVGQMIWLENEAKECLRVYCLVFMHMPLNNPNSLHIMGEGNPKVASETGELKKLFVQDQIKEIFAGHLHFSSSYELEGLKTTIVGAVTSERNAQSPKFIEVTLNNGQIISTDVFVAN